MTCPFRQTFVKSLHLLLITSFALAPLARADAADPSPIDWDHVARLKREPVRTYFSDIFDEKKGMERLSTEVLTEVSMAQKAGVFVDTDVFPAWWKDHRGEFLRLDSLGKHPDRSVANFTGAVYLEYSIHRAKLLDAKNPGTGAGDRHLEEVFSAAGKRSLYGIWFGVWDKITEGWNALDSFTGLSGAVKFTFTIAIFGGAVAILASPITDPIFQRLQQFKQRYLQKIFLPWNYWITGEYGRRRAARRSSASEASAKRTAPVGTTPDDYDDFLRRFKEVGPLIDQNFKSVMSQDFKDARNSMMDVLHRSLNSLGDRLRSSRIEKAQFAQNYNLLTPRFSRVDETALQALVQAIEEAKWAAIQRGFLSVEAVQRREKLERTLKNYRDHTDYGLSAQDLHEFVAYHNDRLNARFTAGAAIAEGLDYEQLYEEQYSMITSKLDSPNTPATLRELGKWIFEKQEAAREAIGFYEALAEYEPEINALLKPAFRNYDVRMRLESRGHPFGSRAAIDFSAEYCRQAASPVSTLPTRTQKN